MATKKMTTTATKKQKMWITLWITLHLNLLVGNLVRVLYYLLMSKRMLYWTNLALMHSITMLKSLQHLSSRKKQRSVITTRPSLIGQMKI